MVQQLSATFLSKHDFVSWTSLAIKQSAPYYQHISFIAWTMHGCFSVRKHRLNNSIYTLYKIDKELLLRQWV